MRFDKGSLIPQVSSELLHEALEETLVDAAAEAKMSEKQVRKFLDLCITNDEVSTALAKAVDWKLRLMIN